MSFFLFQFYLFLVHVHLLCVPVFARAILINCFYAFKCMPLCVALWFEFSIKKMDEKVGLKIERKKNKINNTIDCNGKINLLERDIKSLTKDH